MVTVIRAMAAGEVLKIMIFYIFSFCSQAHAGRGEMTLAELEKLERTLAKSPNDGNTQLSIGVWPCVFVSPRLHRARTFLPPRHIYVLYMVLYSLRRLRRAREARAPVCSYVYISIYYTPYMCAYM